MQVFRIWPLVTERGGRCSPEPLVAEAVSAAQLEQALPAASMFAGRWLAPGAGKGWRRGWERGLVPPGAIHGRSAEAEAEGNGVALAVSRRQNHHRIGVVWVGRDL